MMRGKGGGRQKQESTDSLSEDSTETTYGTICRVIDVEESSSTDPPPHLQREREREQIYNKCDDDDHSLLGNSDGDADPACLLCAAKQSLSLLAQQILLT